jgi:Zn finger protein HypA/HybF involved in hydrogenase expression
MGRTSSELVRCLECGTEYRLESNDGEAGPCPHCGGVGWIALDARDKRPTEKTS